MLFARRVARAWAWDGGEQFPSFSGAAPENIQENILCGIYIIHRMSGQNRSTPREDKVHHVVNDRHGE